jgi:hypothetical protein
VRATMKKPMQNRHKISSFVLKCLDLDSLLLISIVSPWRNGKMDIDQRRTKASLGMSKILVEFNLVDSDHLN